MTWPFENDTSAITKKLALKSIKADCRKLLYTSLTIAIAMWCIVFYQRSRYNGQKAIGPGTFLLAPTRRWNRL